MYKLLLLTSFICTVPLFGTITTLKEQLTSCHQKALNGISIPEIIIVFTNTMKELEEIRERIEDISLSCNDAVQTMITFSGDMNAVSGRMNALCEKKNNHLTVKTSLKTSHQLQLIDKTLIKIDSTLKKLTSKAPLNLPSLVRALESIVENITAIEASLKKLLTISNQATIFIAIISLNVRMITERINIFLEKPDDDGTPFPYDL